MKIIEKKLLKFKNIEIIYATEKQYWGITLLGVKKCIGLEIFNIFLKNKYLISYKDSKFIKKGVNFKLVVKGVEVYLKNVIKTIGCLNSHLPRIQNNIKKNLKINQNNGCVKKKPFLK